MTIIETALHSYRYLLNKHHPTELKQLACVDAALIDFAPLRERLDYVHKIGLRFGMMKSSDKPEPYLMHTWTDDSDHERMFREWTESIGWEDREKKLQDRLAKYEAIAVMAVPGEHGEGVEQPASPEHLKATIDALQKEWDGAETRLAKMEAVSKAHFDAHLETSNLYTALLTETETLRRKLSAPTTPPANKVINALANAKPNPHEIDQAISKNLIELVDATSCPPANGATPLTDEVWRLNESKDWKETFDAMHSHAERLELKLTALREENGRLTKFIDKQQECMLTLQPERDALRLRVAELETAQPINTHVRMFDLVRIQRAELHAAELITDEEYSWLSGHADMANAKGGGSPSPRRLEDYDELRQRLTELEKENESLAQANKAYENDEPKLRQQIAGLEKQHTDAIDEISAQAMLMDEQRATITALEADKRTLRQALESCDKAFADWQVGQIPGRPEDILVLINSVRAALAATAREGGET